MRYKTGNPFVIKVALNKSFKSTYFGKVEKYYLFN